MARRLRIQSEGAIYHVINRGNYRRDLFDSPATAAAFLSALAEACELHQWRLHAYAIMRNHFHLALETPQANLATGMHWLQATFTTRFNRLRNERGHLFQGRYQALLVEDAAALARVVNYIHLNSVRAGVMPASQVAAFRWSSLARFSREGRPGWLAASPWLEFLGFADNPRGWRSYAAWLAALAADPSAPEREGWQEMSVGWAIGTAGWRKAVAKDLSRRALVPESAKSEAPEIKNQHWASALRRVLGESGHATSELATTPKGAVWKISLARRLRREAGASTAWIAENLKMGSPNSVRSYLSRGQNAQNQQLST